MPDIDVLAAARVSELFLSALRAEYALHERLHEVDPAAFARVAPRVRAIAAQGESRIDAALIGLLPALEIISVMGVGYDGVDVAAAKARGVMVTHTPDVLNDDVADLAIALMICASRRLAAADRFVRDGRWEKGPMPLAHKMSGRRLGLVGMGRIGKAIAHRAVAFGMQIAYTSRSPRPDVPYTYFDTPVALAAHSEFLVVIVPGGQGTRKLIDAEVLRSLGPKGILINVARGSVVDEAALVDALERGVIAGAALDVFENEPHVPARLREMPQVVLTPHIGSATAETRGAMADLAMRNLKEHFAGRKPITPVPEWR